MKKDILQKLPFFDRYFDRTVPPEDNVSTPMLLLNPLFPVFYICALNILLLESVPREAHALSMPLDLSGRVTLIRLN